MSMDGFFDAGPIDAFPHGRARVVLIDNVRVAVFRLDSGWYALRDACPHMGSSLAQGRVQDGRVTCRWPVIRASSSAPTSISFAFCVASPSPM